jgi:hypothetical protein
MDPGQQVQLSLPDLIAQTPGLAGSQVQAVNPDGSASLRTQDGQSIQFDPISYAKSSGIDPMKMKVQYNTPDTALNDNPVGFADGIKMALSDPKHQQAQLITKYGQQNVMPNSEGGFLVNDSGTWKKADPGFLSKLASYTPEMTAYGAGEAAGGALGMAVAGPPGAFIGSQLGGAGAAALASVVKEKGADVLNLRSEMDAQEAAKIFGHEVVNNLIWGMALKPLEYGAKALGGAAKAVGGKILDTLDKDGMAAMAEKLLPGTSKTDWSTVVRSGADAQAVRSGIQSMSDYADQAANSVVKGPDPMTRGMVSTMKGFMDNAKTAAQKMYGDMWNSLDEAGVTQAPVNVADSVTKLKSDMMGMGLIDKDAAGNEFFNPTPKSQDADRILQVFDSKSRNTIKQVYDQISNVTAKNGGNVPFSLAKKLIDGTDDILENSGFYKNGENALSNNVRRSLSAFRESLSSNIADGIKDQAVVKGGAAENALQYFKDVNSKYSQYRSIMNDFSMSNKFGGDIRQTTATVERMLGDKGYGLEDNFMKLGSAVGQDGEPVLQKLQQMRAAKNLSEQYTSNTGVLAFARETLTGGPKDWANTLGRMTQTADNFSKEWNNSLMSKIPAKGATKALVGARAQMTDFVSKLGPQEKMKLLTNPILLRSMVDAVESTPQLQQSAVGQLMNNAQQAMQPKQGQ